MTEAWGMSFCQLAGVGLVALACTPQACSSNYQHEISCRGALQVVLLHMADSQAAVTAIGIWKQPDAEMER